MATDTNMSQKERYDSTQVPLSQVFTPDNRSISDASGDAAADMTTGSTAYGASYGPNTYAADNSVAPVSVVMSPQITKAKSGQTSMPSASQSGGINWMTLAAVGLPIAAVLIVRAIMNKKQPSTNVYVDNYYPWW